jgi:predicted GH43/DUF377 family glycosyl hydrolase
MSTLKIENKGIILEPTELPFESQGVMNPACIEVNGVVHMFYRAVKPGNYSSIGYCQIKDGKVVERLDHPVLSPEHEYEQHGMEDPRIICLEGLYYLFYTAYDGKNARGAYATSPDLIHFTKQGIISPEILYREALTLIEQSSHSPRLYFEYARQVMEYNGLDVFVWDKDVSMFPKKINGQFWMIHRIMPSIQIATFTNFSDLSPAYWYNYFKSFNHSSLITPEHPFENRYIGGGCPPLETKDGWLFIYHAVEQTDTEIKYSAGAVLLDLENPRNIIGRLPYPLFSPEEPWETTGNVSNVVFPTGAIIHDDTLDIYYGAADTRIGLKSMSLSALLSELKKYSSLT